MKKRILGVAAMLLAAGLLVGCGSQDEPALNEMDVDKYVTLGDYRNLDVSVEPITVDEDELVQWLREVYHENMSEEDEVTDHAVEVGDAVDIDYEGKKDGVAFSGGTAQGALLVIGSHTFIDGFEDGLVGVMPGETVDLNLSFPENYGNADLAGQAVVFTVTVNYILPAVEDMKDSVVARIGADDISTVEELRQYMYDYLYSLAESDALGAIQNDILDALIAQSTFEELPRTMVEYNRSIYVSSLELQAVMYGMTPDDFAGAFLGMTVDEFADTYAESSVQQNLVLQAIANREGLKISDEELQEQLDTYTANLGYASVEEFLGDSSEEDFRDYLMGEKVLEFLMDLL